jgi:hypothetical protein
MKVDLTDFENFKEEIRKSHTKYLLNVKERIWSEKYEQLMPLVLPNIKNAFKSNWRYNWGWNRNRSHVTDFGADDAKIAKEAVPEKFHEFGSWCHTG